MPQTKKATNPTQVSLIISLVLSIIAGVLSILLKQPVLSLLFFLILGFLIPHHY